MLKILTWNIACLPRYMNLLRNPNRKIDEIIEKIKSTDSSIICLQEVFDLNIGNKICTLLEKDFKVYYSNKSNSNFIHKNGLIIASKYEILDTFEYDFKNKEGIESFIHKGIISILIDHDYFGKTIIHNTHMQSDTYFWPYFASIKNRKKQMNELKDYLKDNQFKKKTNILCGDLNDYHTFVDNFKNEIKYDKINEKEIVTFPSSKCQLDYILINNNLDDYKIEYQCLQTCTDNLSDHNMLVCNLKLNNLCDSAYRSQEDSE